VGTAPQPVTALEHVEVPVENEITIAWVGLAGDEYRPKAAGQAWSESDLKPMAGYAARLGLEHLPGVEPGPELSLAPRQVEIGKPRRRVMDVAKLRDWENGIGTS